MKRIGKFVMIAAMAMASYSASAELEPQWSKGTMMVNAAVGVQPFGGTVSLDYVLVDEWWKGHFTVGGQVGFEANKYWKTLSAAPRVTYGLNITEKFEVHVGFAAGYYHDFGSYYSYRGFYSNEFVGMHFSFSDSMAFTAQVGYAAYSPTVTAGVSFRF